MRLSSGRSLMHQVRTPDGLPLCSLAKPHGALLARIGLQGNSEKLEARTMARLNAGLVQSSGDQFPFRN